MNDLLERLASLDPVSDDAFAATYLARGEALRDRIVATPFERVPRWRVALRRPGPSTRRLTVILTALAVATAGILIPIRLFGHRDAVVPAASTDRLLTTIRDLSREDPPGTVAFVDLDTGAVTPIGSGIADEATPVWSPDGSQMAFVRERDRGADLVLAEADGANERILADAGSSSWASLSWSPDASMIATWGAGHDLQRIDVATGEVTRIPVPREFSTGGPVAWSPDGTTLAFVASPADDDFGLSYLYAIDADGGDLRQLVEDPVLQIRTPPAWSPDGRTLVYDDLSNELAALDLESGRAVELTNSANDGPGAIFGISTAPTFSPDGTRIAFLRNSPDTGLYEVWVMDADGSNERRITHETTVDMESLDWQPVIQRGSGG
jgi:dipeptidyl aminopeptidase/acylaminoacyl peptidase